MSDDTNLPDERPPPPPGQLAAVTSRPNLPSVNKMRAIIRQYSGVFAPREVRTTNRHTIHLPPETARYIDALVEDHRTYYEGFNDFVVHAIMELLEAYHQQGWMDSSLATELSYTQQIRRAAHERARRRELVEDMHMFDDEILYYIKTRD